MGSGKMKILYLHQYFNTPKMSGGVRSYVFASRLVKAGHEVHMVTSDRNVEDEQPGWRYENVDGIHVHWYGLPYSNKFGFYKRALAFLKFSFAARSKAIKTGGDIVFATSTPLTIALPGVAAAKSLKIPLVFEVRDLWPELPIAIGALKNPLLIWCAKKLEQYAYANSDYVVALSPGMAQGVADCGFPNEKIVTIPNMSDVQRFRRNGDLSQAFREHYPELIGRKIVLYAGTLGALNGVSYFAEIASHAIKLDPSINFVVVGDGAERELLLEKARALGVLGKNLHYLGRVSKDEIAEFFSLATLGCSLFIDLPEMWHNSANKFFDTLAAGKPIMINHEGWQADELRETGAGVVVPPDDPQRSAQILLDFINNPDRIAAAESASRTLADKKYNAEVLFAQFAATLNRAREEVNAAKS
jgi:glycosyltransferase involved in cell wall biosynthesis